MEPTQPYSSPDATGGSCPTPAGIKGQNCGIPIEREQQHKPEGCVRAPNHWGKALRIALQIQKIKCKSFKRKLIVKLCETWKLALAGGK